MRRDRLRSFRETIILKDLIKLFVGGESLVSKRLGNQAVCMGDVFLDFRPRIRPDDVQALLATLPEIGENDHLTIVVERTDAHQTGELFDVLEDNGFDYQPHGGHDEEYSIIAKRRSK